MKVVVRDLDAEAYEEANATEQIIDLDKNVIRILHDDSFCCAIRKLERGEEGIIIRIFSKANGTRVETALV